VAKEVAERTTGDESILSQINKRLDGIDSLFDNKLKDEVKIMTGKIDTLGDDMKIEREQNEKSREELKKTLEDLKGEQEKKMQEIEEKIDTSLEESQKKLEEHLKKVETDIKGDVKKQKDRID